MNAAESDVEPDLESPPDGGGQREPAGELARGRRIAFRVVAVLTALWLLLLNVFGLTEVVLMWLPTEMLVPFADGTFDSVTELEMHRTHFMGVGIVAWATVLAAAVQLRRPERRVAPLLLLVVIAVGAAVVFGLSGTFGAWVLEEGTVLVPVLLLAGLHPRAGDLLRRPRFDRTMAGLTVVASLPWAVFAVDHAGLQLADATGDPHAAVEHWAVAALLATVIVASGVIGSSDHDGWRLPAWIAAVGSVLYGTHSLAFPDQASALSTAWAISAIVWGLVFAASVIRRSRDDAALE